MTADGTPMFDSDFADQVGKKCCEKYHQLPCTGKPQKDKEWTHMAAIVLCKGNSQKEVEVISMGTGSKCIGQSKMSNKGDILNDSHAEVIARRAFLRYLYHQILLAINHGTSDVATYISEKGACELDKSVSFHLFTSHTPCGDASIFPKQIDSDLDDIGAPATADCQNRLMSDICKTANLVPYDHKEESSVVSDFNIEAVVPSRDTANCSHDSTVSIGPTAEQTASYKLSSTHKSADSLNSRRLVSTKCVKVKAEVAGHIFYTNYQTEHSHIAKKLKTGHDTVATKQFLEETITSPCNSFSDDVQTCCTGDVHRTGAKCVADGKQDPFLPGKDYHIIGAVRTKPGRGDRTLSLSCSDKVAKWNVVGIQGALLAHFLAHPVYLSSIIIGNCPYSEAALQRAIVGRVILKQELPSSYKQIEPILLKTSLDFEGSHQALGSNSSGKSSPSSAAIIWSNVPLQPLEVAVNGRKQGITKKRLHSPKARCQICKKELFISFKHLLVEWNKRHGCPIYLSSNRTYLDFKLASNAYQEAMKIFREAVQVWPTKPAYYQQFDDGS